MNRTHRIAALAALALLLAVYALWPSAPANLTQELADSDPAFEVLLEASIQDSADRNRETREESSQRLRGQLVGDLEDDLVYGACLSLREMNDWPFRPAISSDGPRPGSTARRSRAVSLRSST